MALNKREKTLLQILVILLLLILGFSFFTYRYENKYSEYNNKTYAVSSADGKTSGTIKTTVSSCGEGVKCVHADYDLSLNESIPTNRNGSDNQKKSYFDANYYYVANIYNIELDPKKYSFDASLVPISQAEPADKFKIKFTEILHKGYNEPDDFLRFNQMDIYDVSDPEYLDRL